jgi:hypothetical protein
MIDKRETVEECISRLDVMSENEFSNWDLSDNDTYAIKTVLDQLTALQAENKMLREVGQEIISAWMRYNNGVVSKDPFTHLFSMLRETLAKVGKG